MKLTEEAIQKQLAAIDRWKREDEKWIVKRYRFKAFTDAIEFVNKVAAQAEAANHHPFITIEYRVVTIRLTSWNAGGLTELDFQSAQAYDACYLKID